MELDEMHRVQRDLGRMESKLQDLDSSIQRLTEKQEALLKFVHEYEGGKKWMVGLLLTSASLGSAITTLLNFVFNRQV